FQRELAFAGPEDRLDPLAQLAEGAKPRGLTLAVRTAQLTAQAADELLKLRAGEAFVGQEEVAVQVQPVEHLPGALTLPAVGREELKADGHSVRGAEQVEAVAPEVAAMG